MDEITSQLLQALDELNDRELTEFSAKQLAGMTGAGYTVKIDRKRRRRYIEYRITRVLPLHEPGAA